MRTGGASALLALLLLSPAVGAAAGEDPAPAPEAGAPAAAGLTLADCIARALGESGQIAEAHGKVGEWAAKVSEARSVFYPKLSGFAFAAPNFGVNGSPGDATNDYTSWGPYLRFEGLLAQPITTFGRAAAAERAARERLEVERGSFELVRQRVALDVRRYWLLHLYARSLQPTLDSIKKSLDSARQKAQELYDRNSGKVTNVDLMKLDFAASELEKYRIQAEVGAALALAALQHTMGLPAAPPIVLADTALPPVDEAEPPPLEELVRLALERRPEAAQLVHGKNAAANLVKMESRADLPVMALVGQLAMSWSPNRPNATDPYAYDPYNEIFGGLALALQFDVDPARSRARKEGAKSLGEQVDGLARYAATGIPVEVRKARDEAMQARRLAAISQQASSSTRKWMIFAGSAYAAGTGETRDLLEGLAAYGQARKGYFDALLAYHVARAQLDVATGAPPGWRP